MATLRRGFRRLQRARHGARQTDIDQFAVMREQEFELTAEIARRRLAGARQHQFGTQLAVELGGAQADLVQVILVAEVHPRRHHVDVQALLHVLGQVGGAVGDHRHADRAGGGAGLGVHVVGLAAFDPAETRGGLEHRARVRHVRMQAQAGVAAGDHHAGRAQFADGGAQAGAVQAFAHQQAFAAPAVLGSASPSSPWASAASRSAGSSSATPTASTAPESMNSPMPSSRSTNPLGASVHHAGFREYRELVRGVGERAAAVFERAPEPVAQVTVAAALFQCFGEGGDHAQDRAFLRLRVPSGPIRRRRERRARGLRVREHAPGRRPRPRRSGTAPGWRPNCRAPRPPHPRRPGAAGRPRPGAAAERTGQHPAQVKARLLPVSPSGTGNTLILLRVSRWAITRRAPAIRARRSAGPRIRGRGSSRKAAFMGCRSLPQAPGTAPCCAAASGRRTSVRQPV